MNAGGASESGSHRWARLEALFHEALEQPPDARMAFLDGACGGDEALRASVAELLAADQSADVVVDHLLRVVAGPLMGELPEEDPWTLPPGARVGRFRILELLGTGGMGTVYRGERADGAYERMVAIKMVRAALMSGDAEARFQRERQILARLNHPGIAALLDGGVTEDGQGFLVMELVEGLPITDFAQGRGLGVGERIALLLQVVEAVDYAHRNLVVHRDLKPSNILVRSTGEVKLLDFGIARLTDDAAGAGTTQTGRFLFTPDYAAPEQVRGDPVTTATDVYALGALLYELLTGRRPLGRLSSSWSDLQRVLHESPPSLSRDDGLDPVTRKTVRGDLELIVQRALHKDPVRRYASARDLGDDLRRFLQGRPVSARRDSLGYRLSRLVGRHPATSALSLALLVAVVLGVVGTVSQARGARLEAERREAVGGFLYSLFEGTDPDLNPGEPVTALDLLEAGVVRIDSADTDPVTRVDLLTSLGILFGKLGHYDRADTLLARAVSEGERALRGDDPMLGTALDALGQQRSRLGDLEDAERLLRAALAQRQRSGVDPAMVAATRGNLAFALRRVGRYDEAEALYVQAIEALAQLEPGDSLALASELVGLGQVHHFQGRLAEAEALFRTVLRQMSEAGVRRPLRAMVIHDLGVVLADQERYPEAERLHGEALALWGDLFPRGHPEEARSYEAMARAVERQGRWVEADSLYREAIARWRGQYGDNHSQIATIHANRANLSYFAGDFEAAAQAYRDGISIWRANREQRLLAAGLRNLGVIEREQGLLASADTLLEEALDIRVELLGPRHPEVAEVHSAIAGLRNREGRHPDAESAARTAIEQYEALLEPDHRLTLNARLQWAVALASQDRFDEAHPVLERLNDQFRERLNPADAQRGRAALWLAICLDRLGEPPERTAALLAEAVPILEAALGSDSPETQRARREQDRLAR